MNNNILAIGSLTDCNKDLKNIFKKELQDKTVQIINYMDAIIFHANKKYDVINKLKSNGYNHTNSVNILDYLESNFRSNTQTVYIAYIEITWEECHFNEKVKNGEIELEKLFDQNIEDVDEYLYNLMNKAMLSILNKRLDEIKEGIAEINNNQFNQWIID